jgi:CDGSH iron-sulfur domain-containing protein 3
MSDVTIRVRDNGPLVVEGPITVVDGQGGKLKTDPAKPSIAFCRCGASANKPFCDGSHRSCGFESAVRAMDK